MRLKPAGILIILAIIGVLAYFALRSRTPDNASENMPDTYTTPTASDSGSSNEKKGTSSTSETNTEEREFNYTLRNL